MALPLLRLSLRCPICHAPLHAETDEQLSCAHTDQTHAFPVIRRVPILINEATSVFFISDFVKNKKTFFQPSKDGFVKRFFQSITPSISNNRKARINFTRFASLLKKKRHPRVLVIGGSVIGQGFEILLNQSFDLIETDVAWGPRVQVICDIHDLPFLSQTFDGVIVQAVLEHVVDPFRGVEEIYRVLKPDGIVYAETPFMQQVHGKQYDFLRFSFLGHRRLFRHFEEIDAGACCGPGMALAWSWFYFWRSFCSSLVWRRMAFFLSSWTAFFWKNIDRFLIDRTSALDAASGFYFLGRKSETILSDRELIRLYRE